MRLVVDSSGYVLGENGGISRTFTEILPLMSELDPCLVTRVISNGMKSRIPHHPRIVSVDAPDVGAFLRPWRLWRGLYPPARSLGLRLRLGFARTIWHSVYYSVPWAWRGSIVVSAYDFIYEKFADFLPGGHAVVERKALALKRADAIICISHATRMDLLELYNVSPDTAQVVHLGYSRVFRQKKEYDLRPPKPFVLYVGRRALYKRFGDLLLAYSRWPMRQEIDLVAVGPAWTEAERTEIQRLGLHSRVHLLENVDDEALCDLYNQATACVSTSLDEGFGLPLLEAMACGCPIIASRIPATIEVAGSIPTYYEAGNSEALLEALERVVEDSDKDEKVRSGLERVKDFSWARNAQQTLQLYRALK